MMVDAVGYSNRTPVKHYILNAQVGEELGASPYVASRFSGNYWPYEGMLLVDLTAGDADPEKDKGNEWYRSSSPLIFAYHASKAKKRVRVRLYEKDRKTFRRLVVNLGALLPKMGYDRVGESKWIHEITDSVIEARCGDGSKENFSDIRKHEWLFVNNDPNSMQGWCLDMEAFLYVLQTRPATFLSTMGCNPGGLKRLLREERDRWYSYTNKAKKVVEQHNRLSLVLAPLENDSAQWAYLRICPNVWSNKACAVMGNAAKKYGWSTVPLVYSSSNRSTLSAFNDKLDHLFLTDEEYKEEKVLCRR